MAGNFFWYDVMTTDTKAAAEFYGDVVGWGTQDGGSPEMHYTLFTIGERGKLHKGPITVPGIIRFAVVADPQGAGFLIATPIPTEAPPPLAPGAPGTVGWHELYALDGKSAFAFYEKLFGWTRDQTMDMGPVGIYQLFKTGGEYAAGGIMTKPAQAPLPYWGFYFNVAGGIDAAISRVTGCGGRILNGPIEVPGGSWIAQAMDPQGAFFALAAHTR